VISGGQPAHDAFGWPVIVVVVGVVPGVMFGSAHRILS
jgi:hypothetical protein